MDTVPVLIAFVTLPALPLAYAIAQLRCLRHWRGGWRLAAMSPMLGWAGWIAIFCRDVTADPTSHNLFPFEVAIGAALALAYLGLLAILHCHLRRSIDSAIPGPRPGDSTGAQDPSNRLNDIL